MALVFFYPASGKSFGHVSGCIDGRFISWWPDTNKDDKTSFFTLKRVEDQNIYKDTIGEGKHPQILFIKLEKLPDLNKFEKWHANYIKHTKNNYHFLYSNCVKALVKALVATGFVEDEPELILPKKVYKWLIRSGAKKIQNIKKPEELKKVSEIILNLYKCSWEQMLDNSFDMNNFSKEFFDFSNPSIRSIRSIISNMEHECIEKIDFIDEGFWTIVNSAVKVMNEFTKIILTILKKEFNPEIKIDIEEFIDLYHENLLYNSPKEVKKLLEKILDKFIFIHYLVDKDNGTPLEKMKKQQIEGMTYPEGIAYEIFISLNAYELIEFVRSLLKEILPEDFIVKNQIGRSGWGDLQNESDL